MKIKRMVKRLFAVASGATMLGATAMGALATANLDTYPEMFVTDGTFNGLFVVGEAAASVDNLAMTDIASSMKTTSGAASTVKVEGDSWLVGASGNFLELGEKINSISSYIGDSELGALGDGSISNAKGVSNYEQFIYFNENDATASFQEDDADNIGFFYKISNNDVIARYYLDFVETLKSDITSAGVYDDIEDKQISLMGKMFTITTATNTTNGAKLVLMGGSTTDNINEGETKTYTVKDVEYEVTLLSVATESSTDKVQFSVNGETSNKLADGDTDVLSDGTNIGVTSITYQNYAGGIHSAKFFLGADKIELENGQSMKVNEETISEANVVITRTETAGDIALDDFSVNMTADDDFYIGVGDKLSAEPELDEPQVLFTQNWDITLASVDTGADANAENIILSFSEGNDQADLSVPLADGVASLGLVFDNSTSVEGLGLGEDENQKFVFIGTNALSDEDYFFVSSKNPTTASNDANSYLLQYKGADDAAETTPKVRIKNLVTGETYERSLTVTAGTGVTFDLKLGGVTYTFANASSAASDDFNINITSDLSILGVTRGAQVMSPTANGTSQGFRTAGNVLVTLYANNSGLDNETVKPNQYRIWATIDDGDKMDDSTDATTVPITILNVSIDGSTTDKELSTSSAGMNASLVSDPGDSDIQYSRSMFGEKLTVTAPESGPSKYELTVPKEQAQVKLYVTSGSTTTAASSTGGSLTAVTVVDATKLDSEVASVSAQNLVVVGGPCVNTVAAQLMGNPTDCTEGFTPGKARVKLFENSGKVAMLVAGYSGADTRLAGKVISHRYNDANFKGTEVEVEGTTYTDATIGVPMVATTTSLADDTVAADTAAADTTTQ